MKTVSTILMGILGLLIFAALNLSFKGGKFTCSRYILNSYIYVFMALVIIMLENIKLSELGYKSLQDLPVLNKSWVMSLLFFILVLGTLYLVQNISPSRIILKHIIWLVFVLMMGLITLLFYNISKDNESLHKVLLTLISILGIFTTIAFIKPEWISLKWGHILFFVLMAIISATLLNTFVFHSKKMLKYTAYISILLFTLMLLYDTKKMQINAKNCVDGKADYINESMNLFLDILNLFENLVIVNQK